MPKANKNTIRAWDESKPVPLLERISLSKETRQKYADVCKPRKVVKPKSGKPVIHPLTLQERLELVREREEWCAERALLSRITLERARLIDRIEARQAPLEVPPAPEKEEYKPPAPLPEGIKFKKTAVLHRIKDYDVLISATRQRLIPLFKKLNEKEHAARVPEEVMDNIWKWWDRLQTLGDELDKIGPDIKVTQWRHFKGALKRIGKVSFKDLDSRLPEICNELAKLNITLP